MKLPADFIDKYQSLLAERADNFLDSFDDSTSKAFRINPGKNISQLELDQPIPWSKNGFFGEISGNSPEHLAGAVYSQEASAQFVVSVLDINQNDKILDLAAAPGGKTTQLIADTKNKGLLVANDYVYKRAKVLSQNVERFGGTNTIVTSNSAEQLAKYFDNFFDKIVLDAPCSGEGMFRKNPNAISYWHKDYPKQCSKLQKEILNSAIGMLKPGGQLVYSTCTFAPEENEQVISWLLEQFPEMAIETIDKSSDQNISDGQPNWSDNNPELLKTARFWPDKIKAEGHFIAKLSKRTEQVPLEFKELKSNLKSENLKIFNDFANDAFLDFKPERLYQIDNRLFELPEETPSLITKLTILRIGLELGEFKKRRFEPSHAIATAINPQSFKNVYPVSQQEFKAFVHGDTLTVDSSQYGNGWYLLTYDNNGIGLGKNTNGIIKNHFPKGLRFSINSD